MVRYGFTPRENQIALLVRNGDDNKLIAKTLFISPHTLSVHLKSIYNKMNTKTKAKTTAMLNDVGLKL